MIKKKTAYKKTPGTIGLMGLMSLFKTKANKGNSKPTCVKNVYAGEKKPRKLKIQKKSEANIIKYIKNLLGLKKENERLNIKRY